jgi:hypothetical protein
MFVNRETYWEQTVQRKERKSPHETHWTQHAERYLKLVHAALAKNPGDLQLQELLQAMEATVALRKSPVH